jgi:hypothetical protein
MILRFGDTIYDLKYCEKIYIHKPFLYLRFFNGREEIIDLREYDCNPELLLNAITFRKNDDDYKWIKPRDDKKELTRFEELGRELGLM